MKQHHLASLEEKCTCGAHLYLILRERSRGFSLGVLHVQPGMKGRQDLKILTYVPRSALNIHSPGKNGPGDLLSFKEILLQHVREEMSLLTRIQKRDKSKKK